MFIPIAQAYTLADAITDLTDNLPESDGLPDGVYDSVNLIILYAQPWESIIPFDTLFFLAGLGIAFELILMAFNVFRFGINLVRGGNA